MHLAYKLVYLKERKKGSRAVIVMALLTVVGICSAEQLYANAGQDSELCFFITTEMMQWIRRKVLDSDGIVAFVSKLIWG